eukprot:CAMPEP_0197676456 /NCGR_PEP_ID=MMETSP1338-20131121/86823_1 /TAXON_ID=43686 ORGANISM="Pelagodinium beii, Strain RCC1491" /NCGR_SAMPLE_ID=MMETSP1338 /ASSEMBLY_ACC=CAM_ASM_000754 /LENGTH=49 /DNA_ID=CAMNT_0043257133 /DNA_START=137 /DNA_END=286 /DNA_ORIENTATION=+
MTSSSSAVTGCAFLEGLLGGTWFGTRMQSCSEDLVSSSPPMERRSKVLM